MNSLGFVHCLNVFHCTASTLQQSKTDLLNSDNICSYYLLQLPVPPFTKTWLALRKIPLFQMDEITLSRPMLSFVYVVYLATEMMFLFIIHGKTASLVAGHIVC